MKIFYHISEWIAFRKTLASCNSLGFVPTMGNLHRGHLSLMARSSQENDKTLASIFVNPTQFNREDDFIHYPRTLDDDLELLDKAQVDYCLVPDKKAIYPDDYRFQLQETQLSHLMEGIHRPGHFTGMLTIVLKLLQIAGATRAYFGEKDYQQYLLIKQMAEAFFLPTTINACPTIREPSGLAYSSRNNRLTPPQKQLAEQFAQTFHQNDLPCEAIRQALEELGIVVEYVCDVDGRRFAAVTIGTIRLIDNYAIAC